ncbi:hypothetical protein KP509_03G069000 [Ceratopteris richardii]|nr:hypothetical protein KP509_03G069000 [Ceratopteris richardii]
MQEVLHKLDNLETKEEDAPRSWLEVSSLLENLKPELEKPVNMKTGKKNSKTQPLDSIDVNDIMMDLDEETGQVRPRARMLANWRKSGKTLPIHTLEELDRKFGGKENDSKSAITSPAVSIADARASLKPVGTAQTRKNDLNKTGNHSIAQKFGQDASSEDTVTHKVASSKDSELIDNDDFFRKYGSEVLSEDDWQVVEALCKDVEVDTMTTSEHGKGSVAEHIQVGSVAIVETPTTSSSCKSYVSSPGSDEKNEGFLLPRQENVVNTAISPSEPVPGKVSSTSKAMLDTYEEFCPPGGKHAVVLYTTSMRGIRKTYEDCVKSRDILQSHGVLIDERDVSMHLEYRNELRELLQRVVSVPRLFIKGRYIGGAEVISKLSEEGKLAVLLEGMTRIHCGSELSACEGCADAKFVPCLNCSGSCKVLNDRKQPMRCPDCNENGLIHCPICS